MALLVDHSRTADPASLLRPPNTRNYKYDPPRQVTLAVATWEHLDNGYMLSAINEAHAGFCPAPAVVETRTAVDRDQRAYGPPNLAQLRTALSYLDPDCDEQEWKFTIAAMAREGRKYPHLEEPLREQTRDWSSGALRGVPSRKWTEPGGNGLTGEQMFDGVWNRFLHEEDRDGPVITRATLIHKARLAGAPLGALPDVIPGDALRYLQTRFALIVLSGDLYVTDLDKE